MVFETLSIFTITDSTNGVEDIISLLAETSCLPNTLLCGRHIKLV